MVYLYVHRTTFNQHQDVAYASGICSFHLSKFDTVRSLCRSPILTCLHVVQSKTRPFPFHLFTQPCYVHRY
ncbi:hypothetical protein L204_100954 [Cryptococcus depauperatus]